MNRPAPTSAWVLLAMLLAVLAQSGRLIAQEQGRSDDPDVATLRPEYFDLIRRTLEDVRDDLKATEPDLSPDLLRGTLLIEGYSLINNVTQSGLSPDELLRLPEPLKRDAARLVSVVLGDQDTLELLEREDASVLIEDRSVPVRLRPFQAIITEVLTTRSQQFIESDVLDLTAVLEADALAIVARAVSPSNDPRDLVPAERSYAIALARRIADEAQEGSVEAGPSEDQLLQNDLDALAELLRRKNTELKLSGELPGITDRIEFLERFGLTRIEQVIQRRDPEAVIPESAREQILAMAELIARGVPFALRPESEETEPTAEEDTKDDDSEAPPPEPISITPERLARLVSLARAVDRGLIAAGVDLATRRATLQKFFREHAARDSELDPNDLDAALVARFNHEVEAILADHQGGILPGRPPFVGEPPVITIPPVITVPTIGRPTTVVVPKPSSRWCLPWN